MFLSLENGGVIGQDFWKDNEDEKDFLNIVR